MREAAHAYAACGWFVLPVDPGSKHAGSVLGAGWPEKSSRDSRAIDGWFRRGGDPGLALHVGRSGAVAFDVDRPELLPEVLAAAVEAHRGPFQSTRATAVGRGHYLYRQPASAVLGNARGQLTGRWGDVRGRNGIILVEPTQHAQADHGGRYRWRRTGPLPELEPVLLAALIRPRAEAWRMSAPAADRVSTLHHPAGRSGRSTLRRLGRVLQYVLDAEPGQRNSVLHWASCRVGEMMAAGWLDQPTAVQALRAAGGQVGLDDAEMLGGGAGGTIYSGLRSGRHG